MSVKVTHISEADLAFAYLQEHGGTWEVVQAPPGSKHSSMVLAIRKDGAKGIGFTLIEAVDQLRRAK